MAREIAEGLARTIKAQPQGPLANAVLELGGIDVTACETAGLSHDLGHPPFGHGGEIALNRLLRADGVRDGFEGNPQSFRIVTTLDRQRRFGANVEHLGQDLTMVSLAAILKYPKLCPDDQLLGGSHAERATEKPPKFGAYLDSDHETNAVFERASALMAVDPAGGFRQTVEASIMDMADDISYSTHDLEDFYKEGRIDFPRVEADLNEAMRRLLSKVQPDAETNEFIKTAEVLERDYSGFFDLKTYASELGFVLSRLQAADLEYEYTGSLTQGSKLVGVTSEFIERMFTGIEVSTTVPWAGGPSVHLKQAEWHMMQCLKTITKRYVVGTARMATIERSQTAAIGTLYRGMTNWLNLRPDLSKLPEPLASYLDDVRHLDTNPQRFRAVGDYIAGLSDQECLARSRWMAGTEIPSMDAIR